jgi:PKD repeat protein
VKSTEGKDFWFGFMENRNYQVPQLPYYLQIVHYTEITLISIYTCHVEVYIGTSPTPSYTQTIIPNIPTYIRIPWPDVEAMGSESIQNKAIHLVSDNSLNVYALNWCENSADVAVIYPKETLGNEYFAMCYTPHIQTDILGNELYNGSGKNSEFLIVATENNTTVNITPTKITDKLQPANVPFSIILSKGELYQVQSMNHLNLQGQGDLTGSYIKSDKNIAVFSGALATSVPADPNVDSWDHLYEQMPPLPSWGRKFVTVPLVGRSEDRYRVMASQNNTSVRISGKSTVVLNRGAFYEFVLKANEPSLVESDKPVLLAQYMVSNSVDRPPGLTIWDWDGDPFMVIVNPVEQTREFATFVVYDSQNLKNKYYVNIVTRDDATLQILLDDKPIPFQTLPNSGYSFAQVKTDKGKHNLRSTESGKGFIAYVYAYGNPESFGYSVGFNVSVKLDLGRDLRFVKDTLLICKGETKVLDAGSQFSTFKWNTGETTQKTLVSHQGYFKVTASTTDGCTLSDSVFVFESNPIINLGPDLTTCQSLPLLLDAGPGFSSYKWSTNETTQKISVSKNGTYDVLALNKYGCPARDTARISFAAKPKISMSKGDQIVCGSLYTTVLISSNTSSYTLSSSNPAVTIYGLFVTVPQSGNYPFTYTCKNEFGCVSDTTFSIKFNNNVKLDLGRDLRFVKDTMLICKGETKVLDAGAQFSTFKWNTGETTQKILVSHQGPFKVTASTSEGCTESDSVFIFESNPIINLGPDLTTCQSPPLLLDAGTGFSSYKWSTNEITQKISVSKNGTYDVLALNKYGCPARDTVRIGFAAKPKISMSKGDQIICGSLSTTINISANTSNYSLSCSNPGVTIHDLFVTVPQSGNYPFTYTCRNEFGCVSDTSFSVGFFQTPPINFNVSDTLVCEQKEVRFSALGSGNILDYLWEWGDGSSDHQSKDAVHTYFKSGKYDVQLTVRFDNKCLNSILRKNVVSVVSIPTVDFSIQNNQCLKVGAQTLNYIGSGDELDHYNWDLSGFESGEVIKNPGNTSGPLIFDLKSKPNNRLSLQVVSKFGCVSETKSLQLRRNPAFSVLAQDSSGCAPFSIDLKAITNDPVDQVTYNWDFGNGETGTGSQVAYTYAMPKESYDIRITALSNTTGCSGTLEKPQWISVFPLPDAFFIVQDSVECLNNAFTFSAFDNGAGAEYTWNLGDNTNATGKDVTHTYSVVGHYGVSLKVTSSHGCVNQSLADQKVYTAPIPTIGFTLDPSTCLDPGNNTVSYLGSATINDKFNWDLTQLDPEEIISNPSTTSGPLIFNLLNKPMATLSLQVVSEYGCKSENKQLTIKRKPVFNIYSDIREVCPPLIVNLKAKSGDQVDMIDYLWDFGDGKSITGKDIAYTFSIPNRNYDISVHAFSTTTQCSSSLVENNFIRVYPKPQAGFSYSPVEIYNDQPDVSFMDQSVDAKSYYWDFGDGTNSDLKNPLHKYKIVGNLLVMQTVFNQYGCLDLSTSILQVGLRKLYVPNAFSPSAQNPIDREFRLWCNGIMTQGYHLKIFSRWFDVVFECQDEIRGWDGKLSNGTMAPLGNYVWILEFTDFAGKAHKQSGTVTLIY